MDEQGGALLVSEAPEISGGNRRAWRPFTTNEVYVMRGFVLFSCVIGGTSDFAISAYATKSHSKVCNRYIRTAIAQI